MSRLGAVVIGRNEGQRLVRCLESLQLQLPEGAPTIYVDSGSSDGSCQAAKNLMAEVVQLDLSIPFTAARARNAGFQKLIEDYVDVEYVQFIDGDCEVVDGWIAASIGALDADADVVAVCGWRRERFPERTIFNRICDVEWQSGPVGEIFYFGGDVMIRSSTFASVCGYDDALIAGEDGELSVRLRGTGGRIQRLDRDSTIHDADMHTIFQWWQRAMRGGHAYAQVFSMHGDLPERTFEKDVARIWLWGLTMPFIAVATTSFTHGLSLAILLRYPVTAGKVIYQTRRQGFSWQHCFAWGVSCVLSVFPGLLGAVKFHLDNVLHIQSQLIEYK